MIMMMMMMTMMMMMLMIISSWVEFRLCPYDWPADDDLEYDDDGNMVEVSQSCLDKHLLELADGSGTRFYLPEPYRVGEYSVDVRLPPGLSCDKCLLQWKWNVGQLSQFSVCLSLSLSVCLSVCLCQCLCLSVSVSVSVSLCLSVCLSLSLPLSLLPPLTECVSV